MRFMDFTLTAEIIGYTLSREDWEALRGLLGIPDMLRLFEGAPPQDQAFEHLCELGIVAPSGANTIVDELFAFLLEQLSRFDTALSFRSSGERLTFCRCPEICAIAERQPSRVTVTPIQDQASARPCVCAALARMTTPIRCTLENRTDVLYTGEILQPADKDAVLEQLFQAMDAPSAEFSI